MPVTPSKFESHDSAVVQWVGETATGVGIQLNEWPDKTVMTSGTGNVEIEGSMDGLNWGTLNDHAGVGLTALIPDTPRVILENTIYVRPVAAGGPLTITITANK